MKTQAPSAPPPSFGWDAAAYHQLGSPQLSWGQAIIARAGLRGDEVALDAGCGSGRLTAELLEALPKGRVIALDASADMVAKARAHLASYGNRVSFRNQDLLSLDLDAEVDLVFSGATFHWVLDHDELFRRLFRALKPGGRLVAQCGGEGNLARLRARVELFTSGTLAHRFAGFRPPWLFASPDETLSRLKAAGFVHARAWLEPAPTTFASRDEFAAFVRDVVLRPHMQRLDEGERAAFVERIAKVSAIDEPPYTLDYVRLNIEATRP